jgi:UDP-glucose 4-epimerase
MTRSARSPAATVVGASGFIGTTLSRKLAATGTTVEACTSGRPFTGRAVERSSVQRTRTLYWLASNVNPAVAEERPDLVERDRCAFEVAVATVATSPDPPRVVLVSSGGTVYDTSRPPPYDEASPLAPTTAYGRSKVELEEALAASALPPDRKTILRVANAYGPGQQARRGQGVIAHWLRSAAEGGPLVLIGSEDTVRDFVYIDDIVEALVAIHDADHDLPPILNIGSGAGTTLGELARIVLDVVGDGSLAVEVRPARQFDAARTWLDTSLAQQALGWLPRTSLREGVEATWRMREG